MRRAADQRATARLLRCPGCDVLLSVSDAGGGVLPDGAEISCPECDAALEVAGDRLRPRGTLGG